MESTWNSKWFVPKSLAFICGIDKIKKVVTDRGIEEDGKKRLEDAGIEVLIA